MKVQRCRAVSDFPVNKTRLPSRSVNALSLRLDSSSSSLLLCQHEKFSSQLQLNQKKPPEGDTSKCEAKPTEAAAAAAATVCETAAAAAATKPPEASKTEDKMTG